MNNLKKVSKISIIKRKEMIENKKKFPIGFQMTCQDRYQINLGRLMIPDHILYPDWMQNIFISKGVNLHSCMKRKLFRIENKNGEKVYTLCLSSIEKGMPWYGWSAILDFNKCKLLTLYSSTWDYVQDSFSIDKSDCDALLQKIFSVFEQNKINYLQTQ